MNDHVSVTKEEIVGLLKEAFSAGLFSYLDLAETECQRIFNDFVKCKFNADDVGNINLKLPKKSHTTVSEIVSANYFYNYANSWGDTYQ